MEFLVFGLGDWIAPPAYLDGALGEPTAMPFWPHLVLTDVYEDQERSLPVTDEEVEALPGYKFAVKCGKMGIPCVAFTAQAAAIGERFKALWFRHAVNSVKWYEKESFRAGGIGVNALVEDWKQRLSRKCWNANHRWTLQGRKIEGDERERYTVTLRDGTIASNRSLVTGTPYSYLYIWAYASALAALNEWENRRWEWDDENCLCIPVSARPGGDKNGHVSRSRREVFEPMFWEKHQSEIYCPGNKNMLTANIIHMDPPPPNTVPQFWSHSKYWFDQTNKDGILRPRLKSQLKQIVPPDGLAWLETIKFDDR